MARVLRLTVVTGPHRNARFCFRGDAQCVIGRSPDCFVQFVGTERDQFISRRHCQLVFNDQSLTLRDLHSTTGTYLGGKRIDSAELTLPGCANCAGCAEGEFEPGSLLTVGGTTIRLHLVDCPTHEPTENDAAPLWQPGESAKKYCPWRCSDGTGVAQQ